MASVIRFCFPHKTASMFAHKALAQISISNDLRHFSPNYAPPNHNEIYRHVGDLDNKYILFGPNRAYSAPPGLLEKLPAGELVLDVCQVRDPLDIAVSQYFSHGWIHPDRAWSSEAVQDRARIQRGDLSIFEYARLVIHGGATVGGEPVADKFNQLSLSHDAVRTKIVRYEDFFERYDDWVEAIVTFLPGDINVKDPLYDVRPNYSKVTRIGEGEFFSDPREYVEKYKISRGKHVRSAAPGDYRHFLKEKEIIVLRDELRAACPIIDKYY